MIFAGLTSPDADRPILAAGHDVPVGKNGKTVHKRCVTGQGVDDVALHSPNTDLTAIIHTCI